MTPRCRLALLAALATATVGALAVGGRALGPGQATDLDAWWAWSTAADPVTVAVALLRLLAMAASIWIALTAVVHLALARRQHPRRQTWLDRLTPRVVRAAGASLSVAVLAAPMAAGADGDPHQATMRPLPVEAPTTTIAAPPSTTTSTPPPTLAPPTTNPTVPPAPAPAPAARPATAAPETYVVERAESLWSIAADTVAERLGRPATDAEVVPYWLQLIEANADRLVVPDNADLIYAGQELVLP